MSLLSPRFNTGLYPVKRYGAGTAGSDGHWTAPAVASTFTIAASVQPVTGRALQDLPEGMRADDVRWIYTNTELRTVATDGGNDRPDEVTIEGDVYRVFKVEHFRVLSGHYRAQAVRLTTP